MRDGCSAGPVNANNLIASTIIALLMIFMNMVCNSTTRPCCMHGTSCMHAYHIICLGFRRKSAKTKDAWALTVPPPLKCFKDAVEGGAAYTTSLRPHKGSLGLIKASYASSSRPSTRNEDVPLTRCRPASFMQHTLVAYGLIKVAYATNYSTNYSTPYYSRERCPALDCRRMARMTYGLDC
jgi:hypothetical protein